MREILGDYEILGKLGQGGMGAVYRARQISLDRLVALKLLPANLETDPTFVTRFQREARVAASLSHGNLVKVYASGQIDGTHFIAMELIEGETLGQWLKRGPLSSIDALRILADAAHALEYGWQRASLIHRDIKPGNIFLSHSGEVKVGDLGIAKSIGADTTGLTHSGMAMGTPHYISPEQARGDKDLDFRCDIYSLGCTLYQMLTARTPYTGGDPMNVMYQHINGPVPAILKVLPSCPIPLARLVSKMLKKGKHERHASYGDLLAQIAQVTALFAPADSPFESILPTDPDVTPAEGVATPATPRSATPVARPASTPTPKSKLLLYGGLAAGLVAIGTIAFFAWPKPEEKLTKAQIAMMERKADAQPARPALISSVSWENLLADPEIQGKFRKTDEGYLTPALATVDRGGNRHGAVRCRLRYDPKATYFRLVAAKQDNRWYQGYLTPAGGVLQYVDLESSAVKFGDIAEIKRSSLRTPLQPGQLIEFELRLLGDRLELSVDGEVVCSGRDNRLSHGRWGVSNNPDTPATIQSLEYLEVKPAAP